MLRCVINPTSKTVLAYVRDRNQTPGEWYHDMGVYTDVVVADGAARSSLDTWANQLTYDAPYFHKIEGGAIVERTHDECFNDPEGDLDDRKNAAIDFVHDAATAVVDGMLANTRERANEKKINYIVQ